MAETFKKDLKRSFKIERASINQADRTVDLAFSSETPVERRGENEILSHDEGDYDFSRLNADHPLLLGHDEWNPKSQIGVIVNGSAKVGPDKVARCTVRFSKAKEADEIFQDVVDGIRKLVSVGYDHTGIVKSEKAADGRITTRYKWMPTHVAIVPVPADTVVGVGRNKGKGKAKRDPEDGDGTEDEPGEQVGLCPQCAHAQCEGCTESDDDLVTCCKCLHAYSEKDSHITKSKPTSVDSSKVVDVTSIVTKLTDEQKQQMRILLDPAPTAAAGGAPKVDPKEQAKSEFLARRKELRKRGDEILKDFPQAREKIVEIVDAACESEENLDSVSFRMLREAGAIKPAKPVLMADLGMSEAEQNSYSILRGIQSCLRRDESIPDGLEGEVHGALEKRNLGIPHKGFMVPTDAKVRCRSNRRDRMSRDMQVNIFGQGGATVATQLVTPIVEILRNRMVADRLGVVGLSGLEGNVVIPRQTGAGTAYAVSEIAGLTLSNQILDQIPISPHRVGAYAQYSKQLLIQSSIDVENFIRDDLLKVIAIDWDRIILNGSGAGDEAMGILQTPGIGSVIFGGSAGWSSIVAFETAVANANADVSEMAYVTNPNAKGRLKTLALLPVGATVTATRTLWEGVLGDGSNDGEMNGYRAASTNQIPNNLLLFGVFSEVIHAMWGGYDVVVNPYSLDTNAEVRITLNTFGDVALRHPQCFCASADSAAQ